MLVCVIVSACGPSTPGGATPAATSNLPAQTPTASGPCIEIADLADQGEPVESAMTKVTSSLTTQKVDDARTAATSAAAGMRSLADFVSAASPTAKSQFLAAATELDQASAQFPAGATVLAQAQADLEKAFATARESACPS